MENNEYSKFKSLNYEEHDDFEEFWKKNKYTKDIFENSGLFAQNYKYFNDIDECVYLVSLSIDEKVINDISHGKEERVICCFSSRKIIGTNGEELMWAHYANGSKGIRIDFTIGSKFEKYVKKVEYKPKKHFENPEELVKEFNNGLENIMRRKSEVWEYEQEHRAIFSKYGEMNQYTKNNTDFFFPIKITEITFGRGCGFFPNEKLNNTGQEQENAKSHVIKIASFIYKVLKESNKYVDMPKFYYHEDKYSLKKDEIKEKELLKEMKKIQNKSQEKIQKLTQKIVQLKKEIIDLEEEIDNLKKAKQ